MTASSDQGAESNLQVTGLLTPLALAGHPIVSSGCLQAVLLTHVWQVVAGRVPMAEGLQDG